MTTDELWTTRTWQKAASELSQKLVEATEKLDRYRKITEELDESVHNLSESIAWIDEQLQKSLKREAHLTEYNKLLGALVEAYAHDNQLSVSYYMGLCMEHSFNRDPKNWEM